MTMASAAGFGVLEQPATAADAANSNATLVQTIFMSALR
jgi:RsiW-degrading membrane proteinase PrsW (M82 family)